MMLRNRIAIAALVTLGLGAQSKTDLDRLQGAWTIVSVEIDGQAAAAGGGRITIQGNHFTMTGMGSPYEGTLELDTTTSPTTIDMTFTAGPETGNTNLGIYQVDDYALRLCLAPPAAQASHWKS